MMCRPIRGLRDLRQERFMSARAAAAPAFDHEPPSVETKSVETTWAAMRLSGLLGATADRHATRIAFKDQAGREEWSGRPAIPWTYPVAYKVIERLSHFFV